MLFPDFAIQKSNIGMEENMSLDLPRRFSLANQNFSLQEFKERRVDSAAADLESGFTVESAGKTASEADGAGSSTVSIHLQPSSTASLNWQMDKEAKIRGPGKKVFSNML